MNPITIDRQAIYQARNYEHLIGMKGFSDKLLKNHFKLYEAYVKNTNLLIERAESLLKEGKETQPDYTEVKRRLGWEFNGMRLHEFYFDNLGGKAKLDPQNTVSDLLKENFGSVQAWKKDFLATGTTRGIGWVILYQDVNVGRLLNVWVEEHHMNHLAGSQPLLIMDVFEHAFMIDYGTDKAKYMDAFFANIDWDVVSDRVKHK